MKKLVLLAIALGTLAIACNPQPPVWKVDPSGGNGGGGEGGSGEGGSGEAGSGEAGSGSGGSGSSVQTARDYYIKELHPSMVQTCGSCHTALADLAPGWMDGDPVASYELTKTYPGVIVDDPATSSIIVKPAHEGPAFTDVQKGLVGKWINMELDEKGTTGSSMGSGMMTETPVTIQDLFDKFANCMDYDLWVGAGMDKLPLQQTQDAGACLACHNQGLGGAFLSVDPKETFENSKKFPYIMRLVSPMYEGNTPKDLMASLRFQQKGTEPCANQNNPDICHPKYALTPENVAALEKFQSQTLQKFHDGGCPMP